MVSNISKRDLIVREEKNYFFEKPNIVSAEHFGLNPLWLVSSPGFTWQ